MLVTRLNSHNIHTYNTNSENIKQKTNRKGLGTGPLYISQTWCLESDSILKGSGLDTAQKSGIQHFQATKKRNLRSCIYNDSVSECHLQSNRKATVTR